MKVSLNWLKKYTAITDSVDELVVRIGERLGAVEEVIDLRGKYAGIEVVQVVEAKPHDNADRLNVYQVTNSREQIQVVSGDRTLNVGDKVALIAPGQTVPNTYGSDDPAVLGAREMRGVMSHGMFGSGKELDINDDHEGVLKLDTTAKPGTLLATAYELDDVIIDIENKMFTHRPDCFGLLGVAREVAGIQGKAFHSPAWYLLEDGKFFKPETDELSVEVTNDVPALCPQYNVATIRGVRVAPSPLMMQAYLKRIGIRPISNVVDATNYLMYLTGQPLHAFDYDKVAAVDDAKTASITVRLSRKGERIKLLDGREIEPHKDAIMIASRHKLLAVGGIMGGAETEVDENTKNIIIEAATFDMFSVRKTAFAHGLFTDALTRFSKGQSPEQTGVVLAEALDLVRALAGGSVASEFGIRRPRPGNFIETTAGFVNDRLGSHLRAAQVKHLLENVEIQVHHKDDRLRIVPPFWRMDLETPEDVVEEIGRLFGFGKLPLSLPLRETTAVETVSIEKLKSEVAVAMAEAGNNQLHTYSFVSAKLLERTGQDSTAAYRLRNALSPELTYVRTSLLPSLLDKVHANHKAGFEQFGLFEIGKSHNKHELGEDELPKERLGLSFVFSAEKKAAAGYGGAAFYQAKQQLGQCLASLHVTGVQFKPLGQQDIWWLKNLGLLFEPKRAALVCRGDIILGIVGEFRASIVKSFKLPAFVAGFELDLGVLGGLARPVSVYQPLLRFPSTEQDICFRVKNDVTYAELEHVITEHFLADERLRAAITPIDVYQRESDKTHKQITYRLTLQHHDRTLTTEEVNEFIAAIVDKAAKRFAAERV